MTPCFVAPLEEPPSLPPEAVPTREPVVREVVAEPDSALVRADIAGADAEELVKAVVDAEVEEESVPAEPAVASREAVDVASATPLPTMPEISEYTVVVPPLGRAAVVTAVAKRVVEPVMKPAALVSALVVRGRRPSWAPLWSDGPETTALLVEGEALPAVEALSEPGCI